MDKLAVLSMHTSPLAQPGTGDSGGMNVYVRELSSALARAGVACDVYTRAAEKDARERIEVEPGVVVYHVDAGPRAPVPKEQLHEYVDEFTMGVEKLMVDTDGVKADAIHANYWLSGIAGHALKHRLSLPLVSTFHTLDRVKAIASPEEIDAEDPERRAQAESTIIACSDAVLATCDVEVDQVVELYGADRSRVEIIAPGVDHAFFSPGDQSQARRALRIEASGPLLLAVGRVQPLKGLDVAIQTIFALKSLGIEDAQLVIVGGPSGPNGDDEVVALHKLTQELGIADRVRFVAPQPHELLSTYYRAASCCVVPSRSESFGLVALEAAACGTPVIASAVGGLTSLVEHGETGYLVESRDVAAFASHVAELWWDQALANRLGVAAARRARGYTWPIAAARLRRLYGELTGRALVECN